MNSRILSSETDRQLFIKGLFGTKDRLEELILIV